LRPLLSRSLIAQFGFTKEAFSRFANDSHAGDQRKYGYVINFAGVRFGRYPDRH